MIMLVQMPRITEIQSSIGIHQLNNLKKYIRKRNENVRIYHSMLKDCKSIIIPKFSTKITPILFIGIQ